MYKRQLRRRLAGEVRHGLSLAEFAVRREGKLLLAMVGLPARGKTYIAQSIKRHMVSKCFVCYAILLLGNTRYRRPVIFSASGSLAALVYKGGGQRFKGNTVLRGTPI